MKSRTQGMSVFRRCMTSSSSSSPSSIKVPRTPLKSWENGASLVKNTNVENKYLEHIRDMHDPSLHVKTIEDELKGTIGMALGKQGNKILVALKCMAQEYSKYEALLEEGCDPSSRKVVEVAKQYNEYRQQAHNNRWELIVHRQAVGFIVGNHKFVTDKFPIGDPLPEEADLDAREDEHEGSESKPEKKVFGDQLDWWEKIGRWR